MPKPTLVQTLLRRPSQKYAPMTVERQRESYYSSAQTTRERATMTEFETEQNRTDSHGLLPSPPSSSVELDTRHSPRTLTFDYTLHDELEMVSILLDLCRHC